MPMPQERQAQHQLVQDHLEALATVDAQALARTSELCQLNLAPTVPHIEGLLEFVKQLEGRDLSRLPTPILQKMGGIEFHQDSNRRA
jgi:hypothetical protein